MKKYFMLFLMLFMLLFIAGNSIADGPNAPVLANKCDFSGCGTMNCVILAVASCVDGFLDYSDFVCV